MTVDEARALLTTTLEGWVADPQNDSVWTGVHEGSIGLRAAQRTRDYSTMWFTVGTRTVGIETFLVPAPHQNQASVHRYCLARNRTSWPAYIALDSQGDLYVMARTSLDLFDEAAIETLVGAVYELVDLAFPTVLELGFKKREKTS